MSGYFDDENSMYKRFTSYEEDNEDAEFLKSLYPPELMKLQLLVEEECDKLEFDGSIMFDQYPDKVRVLRVVDKIEKKYVKDEYKEDMYKTDINREDKYKEDKYREDKYREDKYREDRYKEGSRSLMEVMVINEIMRRRIRRRNCRQRGFC